MIWYTPWRTARSKTLFSSHQFWEFWCDLLSSGCWLWLQSDALPSTCICFVELKSVKNYITTIHRPNWKQIYSDGKTVVNKVCGLAWITISLYLEADAVSQCFKWNFLELWTRKTKFHGDLLYWSDVNKPPKIQQNHLKRLSLSCHFNIISIHLLICRSFCSWRVREEGRMAIIIN